eukprot:TRINITY_DN3191_c0_g1_i7.p1 TRINITY_DN3191_c0_g1~~TRINITY_DN3191_c0_g1_i7.p1  ORF type:complete len:241 (+),score=31.01 TRINITY_DN3191_c0_g1_i7:1-723(+)
MRGSPLMGSQSLPASPPPSRHPAVALPPQISFTFEAQSRRTTTSPLPAPPAWPAPPATTPPRPYSAVQEAIRRLEAEPRPAPILKNTAAASDFVRVQPRRKSWEPASEIVRHLVRTKSPTQCESPSPTGSAAERRAVNFAPRSLLALAAEVTTENRSGHKQYPTRVEPLRTPPVELPSALMERLEQLGRDFVQEHLFAFAHKAEMSRLTMPDEHWSYDLWESRRSERCGSGSVAEKCPTL